MNYDPAIAEAINNELSDNVKRVTDEKFKSVNHINEHIKLRYEVMSATLIISIISLLGLAEPNNWHLFLLLSVVSGCVSLLIMKFSRNKQQCVDLLERDAQLSSDTINEFNRVFNTFENLHIPYNGLTVLEFYRLVLIYNSYLDTLGKVDKFNLNMIGEK